MKIKVSKHKLNIYYRGSPRGSRTQQLAYCLRYAHSQHIESHLGKKKQQAKIPIALLFSQLHFNNVCSHALFYGGHLVMRSKRSSDAQCKTRESNSGQIVNSFGQCTFDCQSGNLKNYTSGNHVSTSSCLLRTEILKYTINITGMWTFHTNSLLHEYLFLMHVHK